MLDSKGIPETCESKHLEVPSGRCDMKDRDINSVANAESSYTGSKLRWSLHNIPTS